MRHRQETRGRPGANTRYRRIETVRHRLRFDVREDVVATDACSDGCWPLITSERKLTCAQVLIAYKYQPNLERRNHMLKGPQEVAPVFLRDPARIDLTFRMCGCSFASPITGSPRRILREG